MSKKKATQKSSLNHLESDYCTPIQNQTKLEVCLILLLTRHETNTHDAGRAYNETCLHSEVSSIQKLHGIVVDRVRKKIPGARTNASYAHYFITGDNRIKAMELVDKLRSKRNATPYIKRLAAQHFYEAEHKEPAGELAEVDL